MEEFGREAKGAADGGTSVPTAEATVAMAGGSGLGFAARDRHAWGQWRALQSSSIDGERP